MTRRPAPDDDESAAFEPMRPRLESMRRHVHRRSRQRLGVRLTEDELLELERRLAARTAHFVHREGRGRSLWDVVLRGRVVRIVYDHGVEQIVTILPDDCRVPPARRRA